MTFSMPPVRNQYVLKDIDVVFTIMAYRKLTEAEILTAVGLYAKQVRKWPPKKGARIMMPCLLASR